MTYGKNFFSRTGGKHFVIDTVRNGLPQPTQPVMRPAQMGSGGEALRLHSRFSRGRLLWIKPPDESDGSCNGGPPAGQWWAGYALNLV